jgi:predicted nucleic acid-binding protein
LIAVDSNILVHAHRSESKGHDAARTCIANLGLLHGVKEL